MPNLNILGWIDLLAAALVYFTTTAIPSPIPEAHTAFLVLKGGLGFLNIPPNPLMLPVFYLGGAADLMSAMILLTGTPPILTGYKEVIAGALVLKGVWTYSNLIQP